MVAPALLTKVLHKALEVATHSWEYGTVAQALLEWHNPDLSVWNSPIPTNPSASIPALEYAKSHIRLGSDTLIDGDGSSADPASLGVYALMLGTSDPAYTTAAIKQINHLLYSVPRYSNGAISHRESHAELWSDYMYMVPPFLAYHAVSTSSLDLLKEAANQCKLYAEVLGTSEGLWKHVIGPNWNDEGLWSTGNAWAVAGMGRVLATLRHSPYSFQTQSEQTYLISQIKRIIDAVIAVDNSPSGLLTSYLKDDSWFGEISGTTLMAATVFRMRKLAPETFGEQRYMDWAAGKREEVSGRIDGESGVAGPAVDPVNWNSREEYWKGSPEGQAFVVMMEAAYRDLMG